MALAQSWSDKMEGFLNAPPDFSGQMEVVLEPTEVFLIQMEDVSEIFWNKPKIKNANRRIFYGDSGPKRRVPPPLVSRRDNHVIPPSNFLTICRILKTARLA